MKDDDDLKKGLNLGKMKCHVCSKEAKSCCPKCKQPYCGIVCQRTDWKRGHKKKCEYLAGEFNRGRSELVREEEETKQKKEAPPVVTIPEKGSSDTQISEGVPAVQGKEEDERRQEEEPQTLTSSTAGHSDNKKKTKVVPNLSRNAAIGK